ncbi:MAG: serine hydrolase domain-containing protein [Ardenticatenaceae bacterium]|nr:serine hydrolase domain-containing protein [Ardenticatenaceae bacterium]
MPKIAGAVILSLLLIGAITGCDDEFSAETPIDSPDQSALGDDEVVSDAEQLDELADLIEETRLEYDIPGVAVAIVEGDEIVFAEGFGVRDLRREAPVTTETLFHIGSTHKSVTAMLIATLVDDGLLEWDTPVVDIYPAFELSDPDATAEVTIRHLLSMSSGIPAEAEDEFDIETERAEDIFSLLSETPLLDSPGEQFSYSNISTSTAGYIAVLADGGEMDELYEGYAQLLQERIFDPIGMETATLSVEEAQANPDRAVSHIFDQGDGVIAVDSYDFTGDPLAPSGSIKANVLDMAYYMNTQVSRGVAPNGTRIVTEQNLMETWQPQIEDDESGGSYGLGWGVDFQNGVEIISHEGSYDNFSSMLIFVPEANAGMVLLANLDDPGGFMEIVSDRFVELFSNVD